MATVTFGGSTLWNDAATGIDRVLNSLDGGTIRWVSEEFPGGNGGMLKNNGRTKGRLVLVCFYYATKAERDAIHAAWLAVRGSYGTVTFPSSEGAQSETFCALMSIQASRQGEQVEKLSNGDVIDRYVIVATFEKQRHG